MSKTVKNEKLKIRANFYNALASGVAITGIAVPTFAMYLGTERPESALAAVLFGAVLLSYTFHQSALYYAGQIEE